MDDQKTETLDVAALEPAISACVRNFYLKGNADPLLGPVFANWIKDWDEHYAQMDGFWSRILLGTDRYRRNPFIPHHPLKLKDEHFDRWRDLFQEAVRKTLPPPIRDKALAASSQMAHCWRYQMMPDDGTQEAATAAASCG